MKKITICEFLEKKPSSISGVIGNENFTEGIKELFDAVDKATQPSYTFMGIKVFVNKFMPDDVIGLLDNEGHIFSIVNLGKK